MVGELKIRQFLQRGWLLWATIDYTVQGQSVALEVMVRLACMHAGQAAVLPPAGASCSSCLPYDACAPKTNDPLFISLLPPSAQEEGGGGAQAHRRGVMGCSSCRKSLLSSTAARQLGGCACCPDRSDTRTS